MTDPSPISALRAEIEKIPDETWAYVIRHPNDFTWNFLAVKISLTRLNLKLKMYPNTPGMMEQCCGELRELFRTSLSVPNARTDLQQIRSLIK